jgi:hypothetical protein
VSKSIGRGKTMVEFFSVEIVFNVCENRMNGARMEMGEKEKERKS